jgi:L-ascorbate metabolism protein UlaG (beta-lactamase superfamily)
MFEVTFLGHQGWQFSAGGTNVLLDPLLCEGFGHDPRGNGFDVFPPRSIDFASCPPIDAVLFSHEHEDHFNVPSIERLDRRIPVYLSVRSSSAARRLLKELGFLVYLLEPGKAFGIGGLAVLPLPQASLSGSHPGEWDSLALYIRDRAGHGSFFTTVDHRPHASTFDLLQQRRLRPSLVAYADNEQDHSAMFPWGAPQGDGAASLADELRGLLEGSIPRGGRPESILVCANGFAARGDLAWMSRAIFHRDPIAACALLRAQFGDLFLAPLPGDTVRLLEKRPVRPTTRSSWISPIPESAWPRRGRGALPPGPFGPATGRLRLDDSSRTALARALDEFARFLYASTLFLETYVLGADAIGDRRPTMAFVLLEGDDVASGHASGGTVWAWHPSSCAFVREPLGRPEDEFVAGARCWASDLLAVLEVEMPAASLTLGRLAGWNAVPAQIRFDLPNLLHVYCHPLRAPDRFLALYRALVRGRSPDVPARGEDAAAVQTASGSCAGVADGSGTRR